MVIKVHKVPQSALKYRIQINSTGLTKIDAVLGGQTK